MTTNRGRAHEPAGRQTFIEQGWGLFLSSGDGPTGANPRYVLDTAQPTAGRWGPANKNTHLPSINGDTHPARPVPVTLAKLCLMPNPEALPVHSEELLGPQQILLMFSGLLLLPIQRNPALLL